MALVYYAGNRITGTSGDTKPTTTIPDGAVFFETDTLKLYVKVSGAWSEHVNSQYIALPATPEQGDVLYYGGTTWDRLVHGTSGQYLKSQGHAANPMWDTVSSSGAGKPYVFFMA